MSVEKSSDVSISGVDDSVRQILVDTLAINPSVARSLDRDSMLFGAVPEIDSMSIAGLLTQLEDKFGIIIDDEDVSADVFETFGSLVTMIRSKIN